MLEKHLMDTHQDALLAKLQSNPRKVTSFFAALPRLHQLSQGSSPDHGDNTISRLYVQQSTDPASDTGK